VTADSLRRLCLARPCAVEEFPFGAETSVVKSPFDNSLPDELVFGLLEDRYELVVDGLPTRERDRVRLNANR
jgi:predicted DNA-binding protein (MmcQ/YjbR family)